MGSCKMHTVIPVVVSNSMNRFMQLIFPFMYTSDILQSLFWLLFVLILCIAQLDLASAKTMEQNCNF